MISDSASISRHYAHLDLEQHSVTVLLDVGLLERRAFD